MWIRAIRSPAEYIHLSRFSLSVFCRENTSFGLADNQKSRYVLSSIIYTHKINYCSTSGDFLTQKFFFNSKVEAQSPQTPSVVLLGSLKLKQSLTASPKFVRTSSSVLSLLELLLLLWLLSYNTITAASRIQRLLTKNWRPHFNLKTKSSPPLVLLIWEEQWGQMEWTAETPLFHSDYYNEKTDLRTALTGDNRSKWSLICVFECVPFFSFSFVFFFKRKMKKNDCGCFNGRIHNNAMFRRGIFTAAFIVSSGCRQRAVQWQRLKWAAVLAGKGGNYIGIWGLYIWGKRDEAVISGRHEHWRSIRAHPPEIGNNQILTIQSSVTNCTRNSAFVQLKEHLLLSNSHHWDHHQGIPSQIPNPNSTGVDGSRVYVRAKTTQV